MNISQRPDRDLADVLGLWKQHPNGHRTGPCPVCGVQIFATLKSKGRRPKDVPCGHAAEVDQLLERLAARINGHGTQPLEPKRVPPRPPRGIIDWDRVPSFLIARPRWLLWRYEYTNGRWTKVPYQPNRSNGSSTDPKTWSDWEAIQIAFHRDTEGDRHFDGIGFALAGDLGLVGWDFDHCFNRATGEIDPTIAHYIASLNSYTEITPSGTGLRVLVFGKLPARGRNRRNFPLPGMGSECYADGRYLTITGDRL
jgi:hypothetical protein